MKMARKKVSYIQPQKLELVIIKYEELLRKDSVK